MADRGERRVLVDGASDERLVALARAGDEQAFAAIVERYRVPLLRYCHRYLPPSAAEDALQQTFINAYAALSGDTARTPVSLRPWLYRVAHNAALNVARDPQAGLDPLPEGLDGVERPDEVVQRRERLRRVVGAVSALPPNQRHVIVRNSLDGESHERIATDLGVSAGSIRQLAHRARRTVREAAAALFPTPLLRLLPVGDAPLAGGGTLAKVAVAAVVAGAAGGGAVEVARHDAGRPERDTASVARAEARAPARGAAASPAGLVQSAPGGVRSVPVGEDMATSKARRRSSGDDASGKGSGGSDSSGRGSSGSGSDERDSSGSGSSGSGSSGHGSGDDSSGSGSSGSGSSGSGSSGSDSSGSGSSGSGSSGSGSSGSGSSGSDSSGSGSSGSGSSGSGLSGSGSSGSDSSGSGSSGSGSSGSGSSASTILAEPTPALTPVPTPDSSGHGSGSSDSGSSRSGSSDSDLAD
jgi:RNA polymerase sigma factor (sigma-70 family)